MNVPPKILGHELKDNELPAHATGTKTLRKRFSAGIERTPASLPVLEAFQEFLDLERRRARNRMLVLAAFFVIVLLSVVASSLFISINFLDQFRENFQSMHKNVNTFQEAFRKTKNDTDSILERLVGDTTKLRNHIALEQQTITKTRSKITSELNKIVEVIAMLEKENSSLKKDLSRMEAKWLTLSESMETTDTLEPTATGHSSIVMSIVPHGGNTATEWHIPIPE